MFVIEKYENEILQGVENSKASVISVPTGTGKSVYLTYQISKMNKDGRTFVAVPRRMIAMGLQKAVKKFFNYEAGLIMRGVKNFSRGLNFITHQSYINMYKDGKINENDILIIDEAHEISVHTEILQFFGKSMKKVILLSATIDVEKVKAYYENDCYAFVLEEERKYKIEKIHSDTPYSDIITMYLDSRVVVGVSGEDEYKRLLEFLPKGVQHFYVHGQMEEHEHEKFINYRGNCVIFGTEVLMSGVTVENLDVIVPPLKKKSIVNNKITLVNLSHAEINQWCGRVGRQYDGIAIMDKMVIDYPHLFPQFPEPEIQRGGEALQQLLLTLSNLDINPDDLMNRPDESLKVSALEMLKRNNLLDESGKPTEVGLFVLNNDMSIEEGMLVYAGQKLGIENNARKIGAVINAGNPYRKATHYPAYNTFVKTHPFNFSQHYAVVSVIENTDLATNVIEDAKQYGFYYKGVKMLKKQFAFIDEKFEDYVELTDELLKTLFRTAMPDNQCTSMRNGYITKNGVRIVDGYANSRAYTSTGYVSLSPVPLRNAILSSLFTYL